MATALDTLDRLDDLQRALALNAPAVAFMMATDTICGRWLTNAMARSWSSASIQCGNAPSAETNRSMRFAGSVVLSGATSSHGRR